MTMTGATVLRETGDKNIRLKFPDHPDYIAQHLFLIPGPKGLLRRLGKAKIKSPGKELFGAIDPAGSQHLLGTDQSQLYPLLIPDEVKNMLSTIKCLLNI